jgi:APA family basic amino acid/polyamine antiporter
MKLAELFRTKSIFKLQRELTEGSSAHGPTLKRHLGPLNLILFGIGVVIGAGIFSVTGPAAGNHAGPAVLLSFMIAGLGCAFAGLCYAEFASMIPASGSAYTYAYTTMGEFLAWIIGWDLVLEYAVGAATVAASWSSYLLKFLTQFGIHFPIALAGSPFQNLGTYPDGTPVHGIVNLPAVLIVMAMSLVLIRGIRESAAFNAVMVALKLIVVVTLIGLGWSYINPANHQPFIPPNTGTFGSFGWSGVLQAAGIVFFAYIGFDAVSTAAQESRNPRRDLPIGILGSLVICTLLYCLFAWVLTGLANYKDFVGWDGLAPVSIALQHTPYQKLLPLVELAILCGYSSVIMILLLGQSRVFYSMSKDGLLPAVFSEVHPKFRTPWKSNILFAVLVSLLAGFVPSSVVGEMCSIGTLLAFVVVCVAVMVLRHTMPDAPRGFRTPLVPIVPIAGILICGLMMYSLPADTWLRLIVWLILGFFIYFGYSRWNSSLATGGKAGQS